MTLLDFIIIMALFIIAVYSVTWYFLVRRKTIVFIRDYTKKLEELIKPRDKEYIILGYLVGYRAVYTLNDDSKVYVLLTTAPKLSLFYYPIAKLLRREDRVTIAIKPSTRWITRELHAISRKEHKLKEIVLRDLGEDINHLKNTTMNIKNEEYEIYYEDSEDLPFLVKTISKTEIPVYKVSIYKKQNLLLLTTKASIENIEETYSILLEYLKKTSKLLTK